MSQPFPYTYYACPCVDAQAASPRANDAEPATPGAADDDEYTFDPRNPRSNYSLYPLEHLLYCTDCHEIRCPRCIFEEVVCLYCPNCLNESRSTTNPRDDNRCPRNCLDCPICNASLAISSLEKPKEGLPLPHADATRQPAGPFFLSCHYCQWSSLEVGVQFDKHYNISSQIHALYRKSKDRRLSITSPTTGEARGSPAARDHKDDDAGIDHESLFNNLKKFYRGQMAEQSGAAPHNAPRVYWMRNSPSSLNRLLNLYVRGGRTKPDKPRPARDAVTPAEGMKVFDSDADYERIRRIKSSAWEDMVTIEQRNLQCREHVRFVDELRPLSTLLRSKKSKRCKTCRQILTRPEPKIITSRYKIKLLALSHIPKLSLRLMNAQNAVNPSFPMHSTALAGADQYSLKPLTTTHLLLTISNPLFDSIRVTLATPSATPGRVKSKVTIICPQFDVGANTDVWDAEMSNATDRSSKRASQMFASGALDSSQSGILAEAGKVWAKGRNWTSVVVEVVPGALRASLAQLSPAPAAAEAEDREPDVDEDVVEIPVFVRFEYETEAGAEEGREDEEGGKPAGKEKREEAFWAVLGAGRISS